MISVETQSSFDPRVGLAQLPSSSYVDGGGEVSKALARVAEQLGWGAPGRGPLGAMISPGARVLVKPNLVLHENKSQWGIEPLVTHAALVGAAVEAALGAGAGEVLVGDAPVQGCDFRRLLSATGLDEWASELSQREPRFKGIRDFRRTTCTFVDGVRVASENRQPEAGFVLFDLGQNSYLEPITDEKGSFRVTCYDPRLLERTHARGRHQYLVARDVIEADVVINLPKLKTHKKAGVTCALKNLIGINGNKEYLPHHRIGGSEAGGDCYPGGNQIKRIVEYALDKQNMSESFATGRVWHQLALQLHRMSHLMGDGLGTEGSWSGNDTIWRTCLDLNRILLYGRPDATVASEPQRSVIHLVDAVIAGQGDGPLAPEPLPMGLILAGRNAAAVDYVGAHLLGYDPEKIPIINRAFHESRWPLAPFTQRDVRMVGDWGAGVASNILNSNRSFGPVNHPAGWRDAAAAGAWAENSI